MKIFISGAKGELGQFILTKLKTRYNVLTAEEEIGEANIFIHCLTKHPTHTELENIKSNIKKSKELCEVFYKRDTNKFLINFSTVSLYQKNILRIDEDSPTTLSNMYCLTKKVFEDYLRYKSYVHTTLRIPGILEERASRSLLPRIYDLLRDNCDIQITEHPHFNYFISKDYVFSRVLTLINSYQRGMKLPCLQNCFEPGHFKLSELVVAMKDIIGSASNVAIMQSSESPSRLASKYATQQYDVKSVKALLESWISIRALSAGEQKHAE